MSLYTKTKKTCVIRDLRHCADNLLLFSFNTCL